MLGGGLSGYFDAVEARHDDVCQQQVPRLVQEGDSLVAIGAGDHLVTGTLKRPGEEAAEGIVVFGKEDA